MVGDLALGRLSIGDGQGGEGQFLVLEDQRADVLPGDGERHQAFVALGHRHHAERGAIFRNQGAPGGVRRHVALQPVDGQRRPQHLDRADFRLDPASPPLMGHHSEGVDLRPFVGQPNPGRPGG